jgi:hypothetical protein
MVPGLRVLTTYALAAWAAVSVMLSPAIDITSIHTLRPAETQNCTLASTLGKHRYFASLIFKSVDGLGTDDALLVRIIGCRR